MRILVTGGAGFIGSHLSERLLRRGHDVAVLDNLDDFYPPAVKKANLELVGRQGPFTFREGDIRDTETVSRFVAEQRPDAIFHLAARAGVRPSLEQPLLYEETNVRGTLNLLEAARRSGIGKFVLASSSSVYGLTDRIPFSEEGHSSNPISPYAATKIAAEKMCFTYSHLYGLPVVCLRFFTVYGPRQRPDLAIHKFARLMEAGKRVPLYGDGTAARDYTFIDDIVDGCMAALDFDCRYEIINLGNSCPVTLADLIRVLEEKLGKKAILEQLPAQPGDVKVTCADIGKAGRLLGWRPRTPLAEGIRRFIDWLRSQPAGAGGP